MPKKPRDYAREYKAYTGTPKQLANQSERHKARRLWIKAHGSIPAGMDVDHRLPISQGGKNVLSNLRLQSMHTNRQFARDVSRKPDRKTGYK